MIPVPPAPPPYSGDAYKPVDTPAKKFSLEESFALNIGQSYELFMESAAWLDLMAYFDAMVIEAENDILRIMPGEPYEKRVDAFLRHQQRKVMRVAIEQHAKQMVLNSKSFIEEINGITSDTEPDNDDATYD